MTSNTILRPVEPLRHIEQAAALPLVQAIHRHLDPRALMDVLWTQAANLTGATGLHYRHAGSHLDFAFGEGRHTASYTLSHEGEGVGELTLRFRRRVDDVVLATVEDLLALAMPALRNALTHHDLIRRAERRAAAGTSRRTPGTSSDDALVLVSLDGFDDIRTAHGDTWVQTLVQTIQSQIHEGLRDADSVFQIDEGVLAVLLPRTSEDAAIDVAGKIRVLIAGLHLRDGPITSQLSACMGVVGASQAATPEQVLSQAKSALADAQREGRSTIRAYRGNSG